MPRNKTTRQLLAALSLGVVVALVVLLSTCAAAPMQSPVDPKTETTSSVDPPQESTRTVESSTSPTQEHNPTEASCIVCHLRPSSHGIDPFTCAECHSYPDWSTATHPSSTDCRSCHSKPSGHPSTGSQCSTCHKNAGVNWAFEHPGSSDCADCHTAPKGHYGTNCDTCHSPSVPFADTKFEHEAGSDCADCHERPHRSYSARCATCHKSAGGSWKFSHPSSNSCQSCHTAPAGHFGTNCATCHTSSKPWIAAQLVHDRGTSDCASCHNPPHRADYPVTCSSCHPRAGVAWMPPVHTADNRCGSCHTAPVPHYGTQCSVCHSPSVPFADTVIAHGPEQAACQDCHTPPHKTYPVACNTCHTQAGVSWAIAHPAATSDCASCHTPPHRADYPVGCTNCHPQVGVAWVPPVHTDSTACASCHTAPVPHYGTNCDPCHDPTVPFANATIAHGPEQAACQDCHTPPHKTYPVVCNTCHQNAGVSWAFSHPAKTGDCASCHPAVTADTHPFTGCEACHDHAYATAGHGDSIPTPADCGSTPGGGSNDCHNLIHHYDNSMGTWGSGPFSCTDCHATAFPNVPQAGTAATLGLSATIVETGYPNALSQPTVTAEASAYRLEWSGGAEPYTVVVDGATTATVETATYLFDPDYGDYSVVVRDAAGARTAPIEVFSSAEITFTPPAPNAPSGYLEFTPPSDENSSTPGTSSVDATTTAPAPSKDGTEPDQRDARLAPDTSAGSDAPRAPLGFKATVDGNHARLSWTDTRGTRYEVQQAAGSGFAGAKRVWSGTAGTARIGTFSPEDTVWFRVRAIADKDGEPGAWSTAKRVEFPKDQKQQSTPTTPDIDARVPDEETIPKVETPAPSEPEQPTVDAQPAAEPVDEKPAPAAAPEPAAAE